ncbi:MAG: HAD family phosphatase [Candidatus Levybacteria bacterium]|nr:HAD family phosphatase [Candidatus Levybacteria bacterium]
MIKAVIFDMDGTIVDTTKTHDYPTWKQVIEEHGGSLSFDTFRSILGKKADELLHDLAPHLTPKQIQQTAQKKDMLFSKSLKEKGLKITSGFGELLKRLKDTGYKVALATGARKSKVEIILKHVPLHKYFPVIITADDVERGKPHPELFLKAAKKLDVKPQECLVIEDANNGIQAAKNADMKCIAITTTHKRGELKNADRIIDSFDELDIAYVKKL